MIGVARQREITELVALGMTNREIGNHLGVAEQSVKLYLSHIYRSAGVRGGVRRVKLANLFRSNEPIEPNDYPNMRSLTEQQRRVFALAAEGLTCKEIGAALGISEEGIRNSLRWIYDKTGIGNRVELATCRAAREVSRSV